MESSIKIKYIVPIILLVVAMGSTLAYAVPFKPGPIAVEDPYAGEVSYDFKGFEIHDNYTVIFLPHPPVGDWAVSEDPRIEYYFMQLIFFDIDGNFETGYHIIARYLDMTPPDNVFPAFPGIDAAIILEIDTSFSIIRYYERVYILDSEGSVINRSYFNGNITYDDTIGGLVIPVGLNDIINIYENVTGTSPAPMIRVYVPGDSVFIPSMISYWISDHLIGGSDSVPLASVNVSVDGSPDDWPMDALAFVDIDTVSPVEGSPIAGNVTDVFLGVDSGWLYIGLKLEEPIVNLSSPPDFSYTRASLTLLLDYNNDSIADSFVRVGDNIAFIVNGSTNITLEPGVGYQAYLRGGFLEVALNLSVLAPGLSPGDSLGILPNSNLLFEAFDPIDETVVLDYVPGSGAYIADTQPLAFPGRGPGLSVVSAYNVSISVDSTDIITIILDRPWRIPVPAEPPEGQVPAAIVFFRVIDPADVVWPINITIILDHEAARRIDLDQASVYIYNKTLGAFVPASDYTVNAGNYTVTVHMSQAEYDAGDPVILVSGPPASIVGGELARGGVNSIPYPVVAVALATLLFIVLRLYGR